MPVRVALHTTVRAGRRIQDRAAPVTRGRVAHDTTVQVGLPPAALVARGMTAQVGLPMTALADARIRAPADRVTRAPAVLATPGRAARETGVRPSASRHVLPAPEGRVIRVLRKTEFHNWPRKKTRAARVASVRLERFEPATRLPWGVAALAFHVQPIEIARHFTIFCCGFREKVQHRPAGAAVADDVQLWRV